MDAPTEETTEKVNLQTDSLKKLYNNNLLKMLSHEEKVTIRDDMIMMAVYVGQPKSDIQKIFNISERQVYRIIAAAEKNGKEWTENLTTKYMIGIHARNSAKMFQEILTLVAIRNKAEKPKEKFEMTKEIIAAYAAYDRMIAEGPALERQKVLTQKAIQVIDDAQAS